MILNASGKTDIVAFYSEQFMNRYKVRFIDVRNSFNPKIVIRINFKDIDLIFFCAKNLLSILNHLKEIDKSVIFQAIYNAI